MHVHTCIYIYTQCGVILLFCLPNVNLVVWSITCSFTCDILMGSTVINFSLPNIKNLFWFEKWNVILFGDDNMVYLYDSIMCMYVCMYVCVCVSACAYVYVRVYIYCMYVCMYLYMCMYGIYKKQKPYI